MNSQRVTRMLCAVGLAFLTSLTFAGVSMARECKSDPIVAEGEPALSRDLGAYQNSLFAWRRAVADKAGSEFNSWRYADARAVDCKQVSTPKGERWVCKRTAIPCKDTLSTVLSGDKLAKYTCKNDPVSSYGRREATEAKAIEQAKWAWRIDVRKTYDATWAKWDSATGTDHDCRKLGAKYQCVSVGTPCKGK